MMVVIRMDGARMESKKYKIILFRNFMNIPLFACCFVVISIIKVAWKVNEVGEVLNILDRCV